MTTQFPDMNYFENGIPTPPEGGITPTRSDQKILGDAFVETAEKIVEKPGVSDSPETPLVGAAFSQVGETVAKVLEK